MKRPEAKFIQLTAGTLFGQKFVYALDEDGRVWYREQGDNSWALVTKRRNESA